jgi:hypothetical protein
LHIKTITESRHKVWMGYKRTERLSKLKLATVCWGVIQFGVVHPAAV